MKIYILPKVGMLIVLVSALILIFLGSTLVDLFFVILGFSLLGLAFISFLYALYLKFVALKDLEQQTIVINNVSAGDLIKLSYQSDFFWPLSLYTLKIKSNDPSLFEIFSESVFPNSGEEATFEVIFKRRAKGNFFLDLELNIIGDIFKVTVKNFCLLKARVFNTNFTDVEATLQRISNSIVGISSPLKGDGDPLLLRQYQPGDPMKRIAWKIFAKRGQMITRELEMSYDESEGFVIIVDPLQEDDFLAQVAIKLVDNLKTVNKSYFCVTSSGNFHANPQLFVEEILESGNKFERFELSDVLSKAFLEFRHHTIYLIISDNSKNRKKEKIIFDYLKNPNFKVFILPTCISKSDLSNVFLKIPEKKFVIYENALAALRQNDSISAQGV